MNWLKYSVILLFTAVAALSDCAAQNDKEHIEVGLRMIGHQLLLNAGDETSRVLPIEIDGGKYRIRFAAEFEFVPGQLYATIDSVFEATKIAERYRVEVENVDSSEITYSYEVIPEDSSIMPCALREYPKARYDVLISLLDENGEMIPAKIDRIASVSTEPIIEKSNNSLRLLIILIILAVLFGIGFYIWKLKKTQGVNANKIMIGKYQFDDLNMKLVYKNDSIDLTSKETDLLMLLHSSINETLEREIILKKVWGDEGDYIGRTLDVFISKLRKKFSEDANVKIVNVRGVGYKMILS